ncbi:DUF4253 domain-containing protein [Kitasatospora sp. NPDC051853]|uniref:DUF4253 domain-containing protein n=1 Tax=Kitasatospora sp. NPDC051853 TaxID=3364058 RepID=UPI0037A3A858
MTPELLSAVETPLPPGRMIRSDEGDGSVLAMWMSDGPATFELWERLFAERSRTGLWPLLLDAARPYDDKFRPWESGELFPERMSAPGSHDAAELLEGWWKDYTVVDEDTDVLSPADRLAVTAPFGRSWPGLAPALPPVDVPAAAAAEHAKAFVLRRPNVRLGLVASDSGTGALTAASWDGPLNYDNDTAKFSAVLASWEERFGAHVVTVGPSTLHLSVAAPPTTTEDALLVAAEHFAFCPDTIWQGRRPNTLAAYAEQLGHSRSWDFWWD